MKSNFAWAIVLALGICGCAKAQASDLDPSNHLHCAAQFQSFASIAKARGEEGRGWDARAKFEVNLAKEIPGADLSDAALASLENRILAASDGGLALATECLKRQEADPAFRKLMAGLSDNRVNSSD